jgi:hypothetical protein
MKAARPILVAWLAACIAACGVPPSSEPPPSAQPVLALPVVPKFSNAKPGDVAPSGWRVWQISRLKRPTEYQLVDYEGRTVVFARANASASGLVFPISVDLDVYPLLHWHWKVPALIDTADNTKRSTEDSPVRVVVAFEGDMSKLPFADRLFADQMRMLTQQEMPYALLMYIWENRAPVGTVIDNLHTGRIKMVVAGSGPMKVNQWHDVIRNVRDDYERAFKEKPPRVKSIGIMTDTDNTGATASAYYGDIQFLGAPR